MKSITNKVLIALLMIALTSSVTITQAQTSSGTTTSTTTRTDTESKITDDRKFQELTEQQNDNEFDLKANEQERDDAKEEVRAKEAQVRQLRSSGADTEEIKAKEAELKAAKEDLAEKEKNVSASKSTIEKTKKEIEGTTQGRLNRIDKDFQEKIDANKTKLKQLTKNPPSSTGTSAAVDQEIHTKQILTNSKYIEFLESQRSLELCKANPDCNTNTEELNKLINSNDKLGREVRDLFAEITKIEDGRNAKETFPASNIFKADDSKDAVPNTSILKVFNNLTDWMIILVSSLAVTTLMIGGFMMVISGGDETRLELGKDIFKYSLTGLLLVLLAYGIISVIQSVFY